MPDTFANWRFASNVRYLSITDVVAMIPTIIAAREYGKIGLVPFDPTCLQYNVYRLLYQAAFFVDKNEFTNS